MTCTCDAPNLSKDNDFCLKCGKLIPPGRVRRRTSMVNVPASPAVPTGPIGPSIGMGMGAPRVPASISTSSSSSSRSGTFRSAARNQGPGRSDAQSMFEPRPVGSTNRQLGTAKARLEVNQAKAAASQAKQDAAKQKREEFKRTNTTPVELKPALKDLSPIDRFCQSCKLIAPGIQYSLEGKGTRSPLKYWCYECGVDDMDRVPNSVSNPIPLSPLAHGQVRLICVGHGLYDKNDGYFTVPRNTVIRFRVPHDSMTGGRNELEYRPEESRFTKMRCENYRLFKLTGSEDLSKFLMEKGAKDLCEPTRIHFRERYEMWVSIETLGESCLLSQIIAKLDVPLGWQLEVVWLACREVTLSYDGFANLQRASDTTPSSSSAPSSPAVRD